AEAAAGIPGGAHHLAAARAASSDPVKRARLALQQGHALHAQGLHEEAARVHESGLAELDDAATDAEQLDLRAALQTALVTAASMVPGTRARALERSAELIRESDGRPRTHGERLLLARAAVQAAFDAAPATEVVTFAERSWDSGR